VLTKKTVENQITRPRALVEQLPESDYFDATIEGGAIVLRPVRGGPGEDLDAIRAQIREADATESDIPDAIRWVRHTDSGES